MSFLCKQVRRAFFSTKLDTTNDFKKIFDQLSLTFNDVKQLCNINQKKNRIDQLSNVMNDPNIWNDEEYYTLINREHDNLIQQV